VRFCAKLIIKRVWKACHKHGFKSCMSQWQGSTSHTVRTICVVMSLGNDVYRDVFADVTSEQSHLRHGRRVSFVAERV
jgi:hypothetical protein